MVVQKIKQRLVRHYDLIDLKIYIFESGRYMQGLEQHLDGVILDNGVNFEKIGDLGVASIYGYKGKDKFVDGTTIHIFRGKQHKDYDPDNPMIHPFNFENYERIIDLGMNGGFCREEGIIFGKEFDLHKKLNGNKNKFLETWTCDVEV
ncbi:MAG: hypothetical protein GTN76_12005 [Candidatus Aenigmarchaeota archaeon]|nr:hypothetical protein [Candidatus Aenigmarchaeota archaeon]